ncbi:TfoX/Sxy family protein [Ancylobacter sp. IITR112]|uniref:TfoX/Sxy family protein n=1 Tax=Ancylobacter sp. IITR112 TaxID=3138073 RepID=UPI00352A16B2
MDEADIADLFAAFGPVRTRRLFGGLGLYADGVMFGLVLDGRIFLKTDPGFAADLAAAGAEPFTYRRKDGRQVNVAYWSLPEPALDDGEVAAALALRALAIARAAASAAPRRPRRR